VARSILWCAVAVILSGCGGSGKPSASARDSTTDTDPPATRQALTKNQFLAKGDAICADAQAELAPIAVRANKARALPPADQIAEAEAIWRRQAQIARKFRDRFARLQPPKGDAPRIAEFTRALDEGIQLSDNVLDHLEAGRQPPSGLMKEYATVVYRGNALAAGYGFTVCGRSEADR
jgi:hypothetical protein